MTPNTTNGPLPTTDLFSLKHKEGNDPYFTLYNTAKRYTTFMCMYSVLTEVIYIVTIIIIFNTLYI